MTKRIQKKQGFQTALMLLHTSLFILLLTGCQAQVTLQCKVIGVHDGDTFTLLDSGKVQRKIRMHGIDAPEMSQPYGKDAKKALSDMIFGKDVRVDISDKDKNGRFIARVYVLNNCINEQMLQQGWAWHFVKYDKNPEWQKMEDKAREAKRGLWVEENAIAPWEWRKLERINAPVKH